MGMRGVVGRARAVAVGWTARCDEVLARATLGRSLRTRVVRATVIGVIVQVLVVFPEMWPAGPFTFLASFGRVHHCEVCTSVTVQGLWLVILSPLALRLLAAGALVLGLLAVAERGHTRVGRRLPVTVPLLVAAAIACDRWMPAGPGRTPERWAWFALAMAVPLVLALVIAVEVPALGERARIAAAAIVGAVLEVALVGSGRRFILEQSPPELARRIFVLGTYAVGIAAVVLAVRAAVPERRRRSDQTVRAASAGAAGGLAMLALFLPASRLGDVAMTWWVAATLLAPVVLVALSYAAALRPGPRSAAA